MKLRRGPGIALLLLAALLATGWLLFHHYAQPQRIADLLIGETRARLGLDLSFAGEARFALWPRLTLELDDAQLRLPGEPRTMLALNRIGVALPWSSLRDSRLVIERVEIIQPQLELNALGRWLADSSGAATPDLRARLLIRDGSVSRDDKVVLRGLAFDGEIDARTLDQWWKTLTADEATASPLPPLNGHSEISEILLDGVRLKGLRIESEPES